MAMCVEVGTALIESFLDFGTFPCAFRVQTPLGPRKSGIPNNQASGTRRLTVYRWPLINNSNSSRICFFALPSLNHDIHLPAEVLIPAPVKKMQWRAFRTRSAVSLTFLSNSAGESKRSTTCEGSLCWEERKLWEG